jgi:hypothetical protein
VPLAPQEQAPHLAVEDLVSACESACAGLRKSDTPERVLAAQQPLRFALDCVLRASYEADAALRGAAADAVSSMPHGWPRDLWTHAFGKTTWSGQLSMMSSALDTYTGSAVDTGRVQVRFAATMPACCVCVLLMQQTARALAAVPGAQAAGFRAGRRRSRRRAGVAEDGVRGG